MEYVYPSFEQDAFNCPHCQAYAHQLWSDMSYEEERYRTNLRNLRLAKCRKCGLFSLWLDGKMIYPDAIGVPQPNEDLNEDIKADYLEAANIVNKSPRGSAALLRLAVQKLCKHLDKNEEDLNEAIGNLVKKGLPIQIQEALDTVRVIGNEAVHPGQLDLKDNKEIALKLFQLINIIAQVMITQPKQINKMYKSLPPEKLEGIKNRDQK